MRDCSGRIAAKFQIHKLSCSNRLGIIRVHLDGLPGWSNFAHELTAHDAAFRACRRYAVKIGSVLAGRQRSLDAAQHAALCSAVRR
jgi:hypothetical protein